MSRNILAIVEGDSKEPALLKKLFDIYNISDREIFSYGATVHDLYDKIEKEYGAEYEDIDIILFLKSLNKEKYKDILEKKYTDIILIFDFDPQDNRYSAEKLEFMMKVFSNTVERGRLYINYPMVEAFYHIQDLNTEQFLESTVAYEDLGVYKHIVDGVSVINQNDKLNKDVASRIIQLSIKKLEKITGRNLEDDLYSTLCVCMKNQIQMLSKEKCFYILATFEFVLYEYNSKIFQWRLRK